MPEKTIDFSIVGKSGRENEYSLDAEQVSLVDVANALSSATSSGGVFVVRDNECVLGVNLQNIETFMAEILPEDE